MKALRKIFDIFDTVKTHGILVILTVLVLTPVFWIVNTSLQEGGNLFSGQQLNLMGLTVSNYRKLIEHSDFFLWIKNSFIVCASSTLFSLIFTCTAGYAFSRFTFPGKKKGLMFMIIIQMFPAMMAMVALYNLLDVFDKFTGGIVGFNLLGLVLIYTGGNIPFNSWLIKGYLDSIPRELEESAYIDGASKWQTFTMIVLPLMGPIMAVIGIFSFIGAYNDFLIPSIVLQDSSQYTLAVGLRGFISGKFSTEWAQFAAASVLGALPILIVFLALQRFLVEGLTKGALKG
ncbi:MAG: sugar ABC transporter permease [Candidatus Eremiobacteraeota bacterium]|nr:sugar ABC transporter permease [Candidatus Eremiobacteraeota bacterium]